MKIAFLSYYSGWIDRGVEVATKELVRRLSKNHEVTLFQAGERIVDKVNTVRLTVNHEWPSDTSSSPLRIFYLDYYSRQILKFTLKFVPYFNKYKYDLVIPTNGGWQALILKILARKLGSKLILQGNAGIGRDDFFQTLLKPDYFIAISPQGYSWAKKFSWIKSIYIPYGVDLELFKKTKPAITGLPKPVVLCIAAFVPYKRVELLIKAMEKVEKSSLLVIGQGPLEKKLHDMGEKLLGSRFKLLTGITHEKLFSYYKSAQIFSLPSRSSEALGIVYIEAMAAGLPIVAPDDLNRREIIGKAGIFVDPKNIQAYSNAIKQALSINFGNKPKEQAENFSWDKIVDQYNQLFQLITK